MLINQLCFVDLLFMVEFRVYCVHGVISRLDILLPLHLKDQYLFPLLQLYPNLLDNYFVSVDVVFLKNI